MVDMKAVGPVVAELEKRIALTLFGNDAKTELGFLRQDVRQFAGGVVVMLWHALRGKAKRQWKRVEKAQKTVEELRNGKWTSELTENNAHRHAEIDSAHVSVSTLSAYFGALNDIKSSLEGCWAKDLVRLHKEAVDELVEAREFLGEETSTAIETARK